MATRIESERKSFPAIAVVILAALAAGAGLVWYLEREAGRPANQGPPLNAEAKKYVRHLKLSEVKMKATESYLKQTVVEIAGKITNAGERPLESVELNCVFYDLYGQVVLRERVAIVRKRAGGLKPGETRPFRLPFDSIPESWNQLMPQLVIAQVVFR